MRTQAADIGLAIIGGGRVGLFRGEVANRHPAVKWIGLAEKNPNRAGEVANDLILKDKVALMLTAGLSALVGFYLWWTGRKLDDRPEDDPLAPVEAAEGEYGFFSPHSWWPLPLAASAATIFLGLAVGWWLVIIGVGFGALATVGWVFEYFRGENAV